MNEWIFWDTQHLNNFQWLISHKVWSSSVGAQARLFQGSEVKGFFISPDWKLAQSAETIKPSNTHWYFYLQDLNQSEFLTPQSHVCLAYFEFWFTTLQDAPLTWWRKGAYDRSPPSTHCDPPDKYCVRLIQEKSKPCVRNVSGPCSH